jgi:hypothetical protein
MRFFTFPEITTEPVSLVKPGTSNTAHEVVANEPYYLAKDKFMDHHGRVSRERTDTLSDPNMCSVTFEIDPSTSKIEDENIELARYMKERYLNIDIYDADTKFLYGETKLPLYELLRQRKTDVVRAKECDACAPSSTTQEMRGSIQIIMSNHGSTEKSQIIQDPHGHRPNTSASLNESLERIRAGQQPTQSNSHGYKKVVRSKPMDLQQAQARSHAEAMGDTQKYSTMHGAKEVPQSFKDLNGSIIDNMDHNQLQGANMNADLRKKLRVDRVKKMTLGNAARTVSIEDSNQPEWQKHKSLREIEVIRESKKTDILNSVFGLDVDNLAPAFNVTPGKLAFLQLPIVNKDNCLETFTVCFDDPDANLIGVNEFQIVFQPSEI